MRVGLARRAARDVAWSRIASRRRTGLGRAAALAAGGVCLALRVRGHSLETLRGLGPCLHTHIERDISYTVY